MLLLNFCLTLLMAPMQNEPKVNVVCELDNTKTLMVCSFKGNPKCNNVKYIKTF